MLLTCRAVRLGVLHGEDQCEGGFECGGINVPRLVSEARVTKRIGMKITKLKYWAPVVQSLSGVRRLHGDNQCEGGFACDASSGSAPQV